MALHSRPPCDEGVIKSGKGDSPCEQSSGPWVLAAAIIASGMGFMDGTIVNVALPVIQRELDATAVDALWIVESYALLLAALILVGGSLGDHYGRRRIFMIGIGIFTIASVWCGLSPSSESLIAARTVQGIGGALMIPGSLAIISSSFSEANRGKAIGTWSGLLRRHGGPRAGRWRAAHRLRLLAGGLSHKHPARPGRTLHLRPSRTGEPRPGRRPAGLRRRYAGDGRARRARVRPHRSLQPRLYGPAGVYTPDRGCVGTGRFRLYRVEYPGTDDAAHPVQIQELYRGEPADAAVVHGPRRGAVLFPVRAAAGPRLLGDGGWERFSTVHSADVPPKPVGRRAGTARRGSAAARCRPDHRGGGFHPLHPPGTGGPYWTTFFPAVVVMGLGMSLVIAPLTTTALNSVSGRHSGLASGVNNAVSRTATLMAVAVMGVFVFATFSSALDSRLASLDVSQQTRATMEESARWTSGPPSRRKV